MGVQSARGAAGGGHILPWEPISSPDLDQRAKRMIRTWVVPNGTYAMAAGECPRCEHDVDDDHALVIVVSGVSEAVNSDLDGALLRGALGREVNTVASEVTWPMKCNCEGEHPGQPISNKSCGARFRVSAQRPGRRAR